MVGFTNVKPTPLNRVGVAQRRYTYVCLYVCLSSLSVVCDCVALYPLALCCSAELRACCQRLGAGTNIILPVSFCVPLSTVTGRLHLRSADGFQLLVPRTHTVTLGPRAFCSSGPVSWNTLPVGIRDPGLTLSAFRQQLKTFLFDI